MPKKAKQNWRKISRTDEEEFLREKSEKSLVDISIDDLVEDSTKVAFSGTKRHREAKPLKCQQFVKDVPDPIAKKKKEPPYVRKETTVKRHRPRNMTGLKGKISAKKVLRVYDLWAEQNQVVQESPDDGGHFLRVTRKHPVTRPAHLLAKPSFLPAVVVAHPGASANPAYEDHQELMRLAYESEEKKRKAEDRISRALEEKFPEQRPTQESWLNEMSGGLQDSDEEEREEKSDSVPPLVLPVRREDRKSKSQRNKEKLRKKLQTELTAKKNLSKRGQDVFRLKNLNKQIAAEESDRQLKAELRRAKSEEKKMMPKKLGQLKFEEPEAEVKLPYELTSSLRQLKPEGSLMTDRLLSFQRRNMVDVRRRAKFVQRYKPRVFTKKAFKDPL